MSKAVALLNQRFAERLGRPDGVNPRFKWAWTPDVSYMVAPKNGDDYVRRTWADRIGHRWMLCQWAPTGKSVEQWFREFKGLYPYPGKGYYRPQPETALPHGVPPTLDLTVAYCNVLGQQLAQAEFAAKMHEYGLQDPTTEAVEKEAQDHRTQADERFMDMATDWQPASWRLNEPHMPGDRDGPVAYQVGGSRDDGQRLPDSHLSETPLPLEQGEAR